MPLNSRADHAIFDDSGVEIALMSIHEGVVDTDICEASDQHKGVGPETLEQDVQIGAEKRRVAPLRHVVIARLRSQGWPQLRSGGALHAGDSFASAQLWTEIDAARGVERLYEDPRPRGGPRGDDDELGARCHIRIAV